MNGCLWIIKSFLAWVGFCLGSNSPQPFPPCDQPRNEIVRVNRGQSVNLNIIDFQEFNSAHTYWYAEFVVEHERKIDNICQDPSLFWHPCERNPHFNFIVITSTNQLQRRYSRNFRFKIIISQADYGDSGIYFIQSRAPSCTILHVTVIVRDTLPLCTTLVENEHLKLSCRWGLWELEDKMELVAGNKTLQLHENDALISGQEMLAKGWNAATVISTTIAVLEAFDSDRMPDSCIVSNAQLEFEKRCNFSIFTSPKMNEITEFEQEAIFTCCTDSENVPSIRWQNISTVAMNATGQFFTVNVEMCSSGQGSDNGKKSTLFFICGGYKNYERQTSFRIGKVVLNLRYQGSVLLFWKIEQGRSGDEESCTWPHLITITAEPMEYEQSSVSTLQGSISNTDDVTYSTQALSTSQEQTGSSLYSPNNSSPGYPLVPSQASYFQLFNDLATGSSVIVVLAISVLLNIAVFVHKCSQFLASRKSSPTGVNQMRHPEVNLPSADRNEGEVLEMTSMPSEPQRSFERESSINHRHRSKRYEDEQNEVFVGNAGAGAGTCRQNNKQRAITKGEDETCKTKTPGQGKPSHEDYSAVYQNVGEDSGAPTSVDMAEEMYSFADDPKSTGWDVPSSSFGNLQEDIPDREALDEAEDVYMNNPVNCQTIPECLYELPDKSWRSEDKAKIDFHSPSTCTPLPSVYDSLRRPEIEQHLE